MKNYIGRDLIVLVFLLFCCQSCCPKPPEVTGDSNRSNGIQKNLEHSTTIQTTSSPKWVQPFPEPSPPLTVEVIDNEMDVVSRKLRFGIDTRAWTQRQNIYGTYYVKGPTNSSGYNGKSVTMTLGKIHSISYWLTTQNGQIHRKFHYCNAKPCYAEQREHPIPSDNKMTNDQQYPRLFHAAYFDGDRELKRVVYEQYNPGLAPQIVKPASSIPGLIKKLHEEAVKQYKYVSSEVAPTVSVSDFFVDKSDAAKKLKSKLPFVAVRKDYLVLGKGFDFTHLAAWQKANPKIDADRKLAMVPLSKMTLPDKSNDAWMTSFLPGKPFILYSDEGYSKRVHIKQIFVAAKVPLGKKMQEHQSTIGTSDSLFVIATLQSPIKPYQWKWGHYAGFAPPIKIPEGDNNNISALMRRFSHTFDTTDWDKLGARSIDTMYFSNRRFDFYFHKESVKPKDNSENGIKLAQAVYIRDNQNRKIVDWTKRFTDLGTLTIVPSLTYEDTHLQASLFIFADEAKSTSLLCLFKNGELRPLVELP